LSGPRGAGRICEGPDPLGHVLTLPDALECGGPRGEPLAFLRLPVSGDRVSSNPLVCRTLERSALTVLGWTIPKRSSGISANPIGGELSDGWACTYSTAC